MVRFPDNPVARDSVTRYITALKSVYARVADAHRPDGEIDRSAGAWRFGQDVQVKQHQMGVGRRGLDEVIAGETAGHWGVLAESGDTIMITPDEGAYAFDVLLRHDRGYTGYTPVVGAPWLTALAQRSRFAELFRSAGQTRSGTSELRRELNELPLDEWSPRFRRLVSEQVGLILRRAVDADRPLFEYGLDSLGNLELRNRIETETGIRINSTDITTVRGLAEHLCDTLAARPYRKHRDDRSPTAKVRRYLRH